MKHSNTQRRPVVAGQFFPADAESLERQVKSYLHQSGAPSKAQVKLAMVPHAGYVFSGPVAGKTLAGVKLPGTVLLLGPNHTGRGAALSLWSGDGWSMPGGTVPIADALTQALQQAEPRLTPDTGAHASEHSIEVVLPFLQAMNPGVRIAALAVAEHNIKTLLEVGENIGRVLASHPEPVTMVVSSDMSHYISHNEAQEKDKLALDRIRALDPEGLYAVVRSQGISMCGVLPMTVGLAACKILDAKQAEVVAYATSGEVSGDYNQVVGYAGVLVQ